MMEDWRADEGRTEDSGEEFVRISKRISKVALFGRVRGPSPNLAVKE